MVVIALGVLAGCEREDPIRSYEAPKDAPMPQLTGGPGIRWTLPAGWKALRVNNETTYAAFHVADGLKPLTVSELPPAGADTLANVNRWQGQLGLEPSGEGDLAKVANPIKVDGRDATLVDLTGPDVAKDGGPRQRMLAVILPTYERAWFFKFQGPTDRIAQQKDAFLGFINTIELTGDKEKEAPAPAPIASSRPLAPAIAADKDGKIEGVAAMKLPEGWRIDPNPRPMRSATIIVPGKENGAPAEIVVSRLGPAFGGKQANMDRWKGQVGAPPNAPEPKTEEITLEQGPAVIYDFEGPAGAGKERKRQYVFQTNFPKAQSTWFFRLIGPYETVTGAKPAFDEFVRSLKFEQ
jgi:hypothetical protein